MLLSPRKNIALFAKLSRRGGDDGLVIDKYLFAAGYRLLYIVFANEIVDAAVRGSIYRRY